MSDTLKLSFGLRNGSGKWLTAESFGFRVNASGPSMKKKQIFFLEQQEGEGAPVCIRTHLDHYLVALADGTFGADGLAGNPNTRFTLEAQADGKWVLKSSHGFLVGGVEDKLSAFTKEVAADRLWTMQLAMHPQVCIFNRQRQRYVHLKNNSLTTDEDVPWGHDATLNLQFFDNGMYGLVTSDGRFLSSSGSLAKGADDSCEFILEFHGGAIAFRNNKNKYLTALGADGVLKATKEGAPGKNELFVLEDSHPQIKLTATLPQVESKISAGKKGPQKVSVKGGIELNANQSETTDTEMFQIEVKGGLWAVKTNGKKYWTMMDDGTIQASAEKRGAREEFRFDWLGSTVNIRAQNGKFVVVRPNGALVASADSGESAEAQFVWEITNRPKLILRGEFGFIGQLPSGVLECNKASPDVFDMNIAKGECHINGSNGKSWRVAEDTSKVFVDGAQPSTFFLVFVEESKFAIRYGQFFLQGQQSGAATFTGTTIGPSTLWEF